MLTMEAANRVRRAAQALCATIADELLDERGEIQAATILGLATFAITEAAKDMAEFGAGCDCPACKEREDRREDHNGR